MLPIGPHEVCFGAVPGYATPACQDVVLELGSPTITIQATYVQEGYLRVMTSPAVASTITVDNLPRNDWGLWAQVSPGSHKVCFGAVAGYDVPACRDVTVPAGGTGTTTGTFVVNPSAPGPTGDHGYVRATTAPPAGAMISMDGAWRNNWGLDWLKIFPGVHVVCWGTWPTTANREHCDAIEVAAGQTTTVSAPYAPQGFLRVTTSPPLPANVIVDGRIHNAFGMWTAKDVGAHTVCFGPVPGYATPPCQSATVAASATTQIEGVYTS
ncbi:MAG: hypothetical protein KF703_10115 [Actinobacteria bacterium]|nr:hypothetical protein [Actinomycetota bacterium]